jgi:hypothetical protein
MYSDNHRKFVVVLNEKIELPRLMNALGHMTAGLIGHQNDHGEFSWLRYEDADGGVHPAISRYPFIILTARNGNQIRTLRQAAIERNIPYNDFVHTMLGSSAEDQMEKTRSTAESNLDYFGIALFGAAEEIDPLTRKFSLFKG